MKCAQTAFLLLALSLTGVNAAMAVSSPPSQNTAEQFAATMEDWTEQPPEENPVLQLQQSASYLLAMKNGVSLYGDGALRTYPLITLKTMIFTNVAFVKAFSKSQKPYVTPALRSLATNMAADYDAALALLNMDRTHRDFAAKLEQYQTGIGDSTYKEAQALDIEQIWANLTAQERSQ
jgi:hypothetical protein